MAVAFKIMAINRDNLEYPLTSKVKQVYKNWTTIDNSWQIITKEKQSLLTK